MTKRIVAILLTCIVLTGIVHAVDDTKFAKENRQIIIGKILQTISRESGGLTSAADSGSGKPTSDMDVTCKLVVRRPDGTIDNDLTSRFIEVANRLYPSGDFELDEHGSIRSKILDTAVHDAKNAVPDFHCALPFEQFQAKYMEALLKKLSNPDAYFTGGGNKKQVDLRMQKKSRLRIFHPDGREETVIVDKSDKDNYNKAMKKYFGMNPEEVQSRSHERDLFGDAYDAYRQAREPEHEADPTRGDAKYNTRIINNLLEMYGFPGDWSKMNKKQKNEALAKLFPDAGEYSYAKGRETIINILDRSFSIYAGRSAPSIAVADLDTFKHFSKKFQEAAITAMSTKRIKDILDPRVSMRDIYDHSQALAQQDGKTWKDMSREERKAYFQKAKENQPELVKKLKFAAAGELAMVFKSLEHMDTSNAQRLKERILQNVHPSQRELVKHQMDLALAYLKDSSNRKNNVQAEMETIKVIEEIKKKALIDPVHLNEAKQQKKEGMSFRKVLMVAGASYQAYQVMMEKWENIMDNLDPTSKKVADYMSKLDKAQSILNLIKVYQDSNGDREEMKKAVYIEAMSRFVPGYDSYQLYKQWKSNDPQAQEEVKKSLIFQGLTILPGGGLARAAKLTVDVMVTGLQVTVGYGLNVLGDQKVQNWLNGSNKYGKSILENVPGRTVDERRKNFFRKMVEGELSIAYKKLLREKKEWDRLPPWAKKEPKYQQPYERKIDAFYGLAKMRIENMVKEYSGNADPYGQVATGSVDKMTNLLFADFVNGLNQEVTLERMQSLEKEAAEASILDTADEYMYGLFSGAIDSVLDYYAGEDDPMDENKRKQKNRWDLKFDITQDDGQTVISSVQIIPPKDPTFEEQNTKYELVIDKAEVTEEPGDSADQRRIKVTMLFKLINTKDDTVLVEKNFVYWAKAKPAGEKQLVLVSTKNNPRKNEDAGSIEGYSINPAQFSSKNGLVTGSNSGTCGPPLVKAQTSWGFSGTITWTTPPVQLSQGAKWQCAVELTFTCSNPSQSCVSGATNFTIDLIGFTESQNKSHSLRVNQCGTTERKVLEFDIPNNGFQIRIITNSPGGQDEYNYTYHRK